MQGLMTITISFDVRTLTYYHEIDTNLQKLYLKNLDV